MIKSPSTASPGESADRRIASLIAQLGAMANFMLVDGREAFELLSDDCKASLCVMFGALTDELQELTGGCPQ